MAAWQKHAPQFTMDASDKLKKDIGLYTGKRKHYDSSSLMKSIQDDPIECGRGKLIAWRVEMWNGDFWEDSTLKKLGLIFQLSHGGGDCPVPHLPWWLTVLHVNESCWRQIMCNGWYPATMMDPHSTATFECLDTFCLLNVIANVNVRDYMSFLEQLTVPYDVAEEDQYLYQLFVGLNANFCLKNRLWCRNPLKKDRPLYNGLRYQVPQKAYFTHLKNYVKEDDISTCITFAALMEKETKLSTGLKCTSVRGCICIQHELICLSGIGDLLKGERYVNMDFIFWSALQDVKVKQVMLSYDIGCQYKINLHEKHKKLPKDLQLWTDVDDAFPSSSASDACLSPHIFVVLPIWHGDVHELVCKTKNLLKYQDGLGISDGEAPEQLWADMNLVSMQMKEMQPKVCHDALEDKADSHNYQKNVGVGKLLDWWLKLALEEREVQDKAFEDINATLKDELQAEWMEMLDAWRKDHSQTNPYMAKLKKVTVTEAKVKLKLQQEELAELAKGAQPVKGKSMTAFLTMGLKLENVQQRIIAQTRESTLTLNGESSVHKHCLTFFKKVKIFHSLQRSYMPGVKDMIEEADAKCNPEEPAPQAEEIALWLLSHVLEHERVSMCNSNLFDMEYKLREGQCADALSSLCSHLFAWQHLLKYQNANVTGQRMSTQAQMMIDAISDKIDAVAMKYHDVAPVQEAEIDDKAKRKLGRLGGRDSRSQKTKVSKKNMSWIWMEAAVHVKWSKAWARWERWHEEVKLLRKEMRCVLQTLRWEVEWGMKANVYGTQTSSAVDRGVEESDTDIEEAIMDGQGSMLMETPSDIATDA
ncbi:hypothetical protein EDD85DRAFT_783838 [Armillaria nabsnona]|nr:hypothetical protein EDD85DRAFT_783838 [Armillaria nabsnona]